MRKTVVIAAALGLAAGCIGGPRSTGPTVHEHQTVDLDQAALARVEIHMGAGQLDVVGGATPLVDADFTYNVPAWKPTITHTPAGNTTDVLITQGTETTILGNTKNDWRLALNDAVPLDLTAHLGAGQTNMTLGSLNLRDVELHIGAGQVDMDLRGVPKQSYSVSIDGGVGQATVHVPSGVSISAGASGGIGDIQVKGLEMQGGRWINPRVPKGPVTITLDVHGGVGDIHILAD